MNVASLDIKAMLEAYGDSSGFNAIDGPIHRGQEPDSPRNCITIFDPQGFPPAISLNDVGYEYPSIQIRVRNKDYDDGFAIAERIKTALHGRHGETWNGTLYSAIICSGGPAHLDFDNNGNARFIINFNLQRRSA